MLDLENQRMCLAGVSLTPAKAVYWGDGLYVDALAAIRLGGTGETTYRCRLQQLPAATQHSTIC